MWEVQFHTRSNSPTRVLSNQFGHSKTGSSWKEPKRVFGWTQSMRTAWSSSVQLSSWWEWCRLKDGAVMLFSTSLPATSYEKLCDCLVVSPNSLVSPCCPLLHWRVLLKPHRHNCSRSCSSRCGFAIFVHRHTDTHKRADVQTCGHTATQAHRTQ